MNASQTTGLRKNTLVHSVLALVTVCAITGWSHYSEANTDDVHVASKKVVTSGPYQGPIQLSEVAMKKGEVPVQNNYRNESPLVVGNYRLYGYNVKDDQGKWSVFSHYVATTYQQVGVNEDGSKNMQNRFDWIVSADDLNRFAKEVNRYEQLANAASIQPTGFSR